MGKRFLVNHFSSSAAAPGPTELEDGSADPDLSRNEYIADALRAVNSATSSRGPGLNILSGARWATPSSAAAAHTGLRLTANSKVVLLAKADGWRRVQLLNFIFRRR